MIWVPVTDYCYPFNKNYPSCSGRIDKAILWLIQHNIPRIYRYPDSRHQTFFAVLPTHFGFENEDDAYYFVLSNKI